MLVALPWFADSRIGQLINELRKLPVNVLLVPDMVAFATPTSASPKSAACPP